MKKIIISIVVVSASLLSCQKDNEETDPNAPVAGAVVDKTDETYGVDAKQKYNIYIPQGHSQSVTPVLFLIHGGGWNSGDKSDFASTLATYKTNFPYYAIVTVNYRLYTAGTNIFPTQELDVKACIEQVLVHSADLGISQRFGIIGVGEGAQLGLLYAYKYGNSSYMPKVVVDWNGQTDLIKAYNQASSSTVKMRISNVAGNIATSDSLNYINASPLRYVTLGSSPTLILQGLSDTLVSYQQADLLKNKLQQLGVGHTYKQYPGEGSVFTPTANTDAFTQMKTFINTYLY